MSSLLHHSRWVGWLILAFAITFTATFWHRHDPSSLLAEESPLDRSGAEFVGKKVCGECHENNHRWHSEHGHASTFAVVDQTGLPEQLEGRSFEAGDGYGTFYYQKGENGELIASLGTNADSDSIPLQFVLGSGLHAKTFLTLLSSSDSEPSGMEHRGTLFRNDMLGITPGQASSRPQTESERFGDVHSGLPLRRCVYCHITTGEIVGREIVGLTPNVDCEKCHGPGREHVRHARAKLDPLPAYSVGTENWDAEAEIQLCGDCHRMPRDVTVMEVRDYPDVLVRFQPIGLLRSDCYLESGQSLRCSSCHNPHQSTRFESKEAHEKKCITCHSEEHASQVACPESPTTGCVGCHMPPVEVSEGLSFHDHWIRVRESDSDRHHARGQ
ncbi:MAG: multiheme c-type cytochrome [Planctomycetota bacterium]